MCGEATETFSFANNLWFAHDNPSAPAPQLPVTEQDGIAGQDPMFSTAARDICATSPASGAGIPLTEVQGDRRGECYPATPDLGAHIAGACN